MSEEHRKLRCLSIALELELEESIFDVSDDEESKCQIFERDNRVNRSSRVIEVMLMPDESEARRDEASSLRLSEYIRPITLPPLLKSISQDSFEVQLRNTAWSDANSACRLVLSSDSQECTCTIHRVLLQVIVRSVLIFFFYFFLYKISFLYKNIHATLFDNRCSVAIDFSAKCGGRLSICNLSICQLVSLKAMQILSM